MCKIILRPIQFIFFWCPILNETSDLPALQWFWLAGYTCRNEYWIWHPVFAILEHMFFIHVQYTWSIMGRQKGWQFVMDCDDQQTTQINRRKKSNNISHSKIMMLQTLDKYKCGGRHSIADMPWTDKPWWIVMICQDPSPVWWPVTDWVYWTTLLFLWSTKDIHVQYPTQSYHHGLHNCEVWQKHIILHDVTGHFTELPQVAFHTIDQHLTTCIFGSV